MDAQTVAHTASLVKLDLTELGLEKITAELNTVIDYIDILAQAPTDGTLPLFCVAEETPGPREDTPRAADCEAILAQAPDRFSDFFAVPKIL